MVKVYTMVPAAKPVAFPAAGKSVFGVINRALSFYGKLAASPVFLTLLPGKQVLPAISRFLQRDPEVLSLWNQEFPFEYFIQYSLAEPSVLPGDLRIVYRDRPGSPGQLKMETNNSILQPLFSVSSPVSEQGIPGYQPGNLPLPDARLPGQQPEQVIREVVKQERQAAKQVFDVRKQRLTPVIRKQGMLIHKPGLDMNFFPHLFGRGKFPPRSSRYSQLSLSGTNRQAGSVASGQPPQQGPRPRNTSGGLDKYLFPAGGMAGRLMSNPFYRETFSVNALPPPDRWLVLRISGMSGSQYQNMFGDYPSFLQVVQEAGSPHTHSYSTPGEERDSAFFAYNRSRQVHSAGTVSGNAVLPEDSPSSAVSLGIVPAIRMMQIIPGLNPALVRLHTDEAADRAASSLGARAFTLGRDIFFKAGNFNPASARGLALLTHELVHVVQAEQGAVDNPFFSRQQLEQEAVQAEGAFLAQWFSPAHPVYHATRLPGSREGESITAVHREVASAFPGQSFNIPDKQPVMSRASPSFSAPYPLKADEESNPLPEVNPGQLGDNTDDENTQRSFYRGLERRLVIEKERRGIDR